MSGPLAGPFAGLGARATLFKSLQTDTDLGPSLRICFDPGDGRCVPSATAQTITDLARTQDAWKGNDATTSNDPTYVGTPNNLANNHWSHGALAQRIQLKAAAAVTRDFHKTNATASLAFVINIPNLNPNRVVLGTKSQLDGNPGFYCAVLGPAPLDMAFGWRGAAAQSEASVTSVNTVPQAANVFCGVSFNQGGGAGNSFIQVGATVTTFNGTQSSGTENPARVFSTEGFGVNVTTLIGPVMFWNSALSQAAMAKVRALLATRYSV